MENKTIDRIRWPCQILDFGRLDRLRRLPDPGQTVAKLLEVEFLAGERRTCHDAEEGD
ncbi:hypothetical protein OAG15_02190 [bacterium]|nr:hypothetical protein [bacterium]